MPPGSWQSRPDPRSVRVAAKPVKRRSDTRNATTVEAPRPLQPVNLQSRLRSDGGRLDQLAYGGAQMIGLLITIILIIIVLRLLF